MVNEDLKMLIRLYDPLVPVHEVWRLTDPDSFFDLFTTSNQSSSKQTKSHDSTRSRSMSQSNENRNCHSKQKLFFRYDQKEFFELM